MPSYRDVTSDSANTNKSIPAASDKLMLVNISPVGLTETFADAFHMPRYRISVTVSANDLIVALLDLDGNTPSATNPLYFRIGYTIYAVTAATSVTIADGTNWFNAGAAELATQEIDYFVYAVYDSNSSVVALSISRIPYGNLVSDFSATTTNEKHLYNYANFTATDEVEIIGRFAATLSAGAGYTWTVPTFTNKNLIHTHILETRWLSWTPTRTNLTLGNGTESALYKLMSDHFAVDYEMVWGSTSSIGGAVSLTLPISTVFHVGTVNTVGVAQYIDTGTANYLGIIDMAAVGTVRLRVGVATATYVNTTVLSSTVPHTWTTSDEINFYIPRLPLG